MTEKAGEDRLPPSLEEAILAIRQLPNVPATIQQVLDYLNDPHADQNRMEQAIARDSALVARLLRVANSPFYGLTNQVQSIHEAVVVLGLSNLRMMVVTTMLTSLKLSPLTDKAQVQILFRHSIAVAICAYVLARNIKVSPDQAFLAGILHDIGKLALMTTYPDLYASASALQQDDQQSSVDAERQVFGFDHAAIGAALCQNWHLPPHICGAIAAHHRQTGDTEATSTATLVDPLVVILHTANMLAHALNLDAESQGLAPNLSDFAPYPLLEKPEQLAKDLVEIRKLYQQFVVLVA